MLGAVMSFAVARGLREDNPVRGVKKPPIAADGTVSFGSGNRAPGRGARRGNRGDERSLPLRRHPAVAVHGLPPFGSSRPALGLDRLRAGDGLPAGQQDRTKPIYLNAPALEVLANLPRQAGNPHVICGRRDGSAFVGLDKVWRRVTQRSRAGGRPPA